MAGSMTGMSEEEYRNMMIGGGRPASWTPPKERK
jgi:protocatechuate 4,5-dioxygenase alpha chain